MSRPEPAPARDLIELILGYGLIVFILWIPEFPQRLLSPVALIVTLAIVLARHPSLDALGLSRRGLVRSLWILPSENAAVGVSAVLFAAAHLPNLPLTAAALVWGAISCALFLRYHNLYTLGLAQGLLGLCFAICIPDALHHHLRVGLGYLRYQGTPLIP